MIGLVAVVLVVHGFRVLSADWFGGDLLYHQALARELGRGTFPLEGPYAGLPTYYPPGFHALLAATMATGLSAFTADGLLTLLWLPVLPIGTFLLARRVTGRAWVALLAALLTVFAGAYDLRDGRQWVNSLFLSGHSAWPLYPRDLVFGLLPFAVLAVLRSLDARAGRAVLAWAAVAGLVFGLAGLVQVQLLLPLPIAILVAAGVHGLRRDGPWTHVAATVLVSAGLGLLIVGPWLADQVAAIGQSGGVAIDSSEALEPARFGLWEYPRQLGLVLPLAFVGTGVALLFLRRPNGPSIADESDGRWSPRPIVGGLLLVAWASVAAILAVTYSPAWPLEDALRPQRMWLLASQPAGILAAIGLVALAEIVLEGRLRRPGLVTPTVILVTIAACLPATVATAGVVSGIWQRPTYAHLDLEGDRVPDFGALVGGPGPRRTVLTYEDWSSLVWYLTGHAVIGVEPAGYAKLAFDPARFTALGQEERRELLGDAFRGDLGDAAAVAESTGADAIVVARDEQGRWGTLDAAAAEAGREPGAVRGQAASFPGNGWDGLALDGGASLAIPTSLPDAPVNLVIRLADPPGTAGQRRLLVRSRTPDAEQVREVDAPPDGDGFTTVELDLDPAPGATIEIEAIDPAVVQSVRGFVPSPVVPDGWRVTAESDEAVVLERAP
jgi:hypothetical protein